MAARQMVRPAPLRHGSADTRPATPHQFALRRRLSRALLSKGKSFGVGYARGIANSFAGSFGPRFFVQPVLPPDYGVYDVFHPQIIHHHTDCPLTIRILAIAVLRRRWRLSPLLGVHA